MSDLYSTPRWVIWEGKFARAVSLYLDPRSTASNIMVQVKDAKGWRDVRGFNSISDDYAYMNAQDCAKERDKDLATKTV